MSTIRLLLLTGWAMTLLGQPWPDGKQTRNARGEVVALDLTAAWITDSDLEPVSRMVTLERLSLAETRITDAGLERLRQLPNVRELDLYFAEFFTDDGLAFIARWPKLERLNLRGTKITSRAFEHLAKMTALRSLDISYSQIDDAGVDLLTELPALERLALGGTRIGLVALASLKLLPALKQLDLSGMQRVDSGHWGLTLSPAVLAELGSLEQLVWLNLSGAVLNDIGADRPGLKEEQRQTLEGLEKLARLKRLGYLDLSRTPVSTTGLRQLRDLTSLKELRLALATNIDDNAVAVLSEWRSLAVVAVEGTAMTPDGLARLRAIRPQLKLLGSS